MPIAALKIIYRLKEAHILTAQPGSGTTNGAEGAGDSRWELPSANNDRVSRSLALFFIIVCSHDVIFSSIAAAASATTNYSAKMMAASALRLCRQRRLQLHLFSVRSILPGKGSDSPTVVSISSALFSGCGSYNEQTERKAYQTFEKSYVVSNLIIDTGVYCGPLRLLAWEVAQRLNKANVPCNLITGQEREEIDGAKHTAVTVEMVEVTCEYQCAVIDEIQMMGCKTRGYSFTRALLGICSDELHLCGDAAAVPLIQEILEATGDAIKAAAIIYGTSYGVLLLSASGRFFISFVVLNSNKGLPMVSNQCNLLADLLV
ncbi:hypothetical protein ACLOJK_033563 [Asimina triloba]